MATDEIYSSRVVSRRDRQSRLSGIFDPVESEHDKAGRPLEILATPTRILSDDTYLTELSAQQCKLTLSGRPAAAARLTDALSAREGLRNVGFAAPITQLETVHAELFTITAEIPA